MKKISEFAVDIVFNITSEPEKFKSLFYDFDVEFESHLEIIFGKITFLGIKQVDIDMSLQDNAYRTCYYYKINSEYNDCDVLSSLMNSKFKFFLNITDCTGKQSVNLRPQKTLIKTKEKKIEIPTSSVSINNSDNILLKVI